MASQPKLTMQAHPISSNDCSLSSTRDAPEERDVELVQGRAKIEFMPHNMAVADSAPTKRSII